MDINERIEKYLNERSPNKTDYSIKDAALALTNEIEINISHLINDWKSNNVIDEFDTTEIGKILNLALKNLKTKKIMSLLGW